MVTVRLKRHKEGWSVRIEYGDSVDEYSYFTTEGEALKAVFYTLPVVFGGPHKGWISTPWFLSHVEDLSVSRGKDYLVVSFKFPS